jgi:hypothetical protein
MAEDLSALGGDFTRKLDWESFAARHPDLFDGDLLGRYYTKDILRSDIARRCFVLPRMS